MIGIKINITTKNELFIKKELQLVDSRELLKIEVTNDILKKEVSLKGLLAIEIMKRVHMKEKKSHVIKHQSHEILMEMKEPQELQLIQIKIQAEEALLLAVSHLQARTNFPDKKPPKDRFEPHLTETEVEEGLKVTLFIFPLNFRTELSTREFFG